MASYTIRIRGHLDDTWAAWFDDLHLTRLAEGDTLLTGSLRDQAALHGILARVRDLGLPLLAVMADGEEAAETSARTDERGG